MSEVCHGFAPIIGHQPKVMILGTMPSVASLEEAFYYSHPRNAFWPIMAEIFHHPIESIDQKRQLTESQPLILWDVLQSCEREGSLDSAIHQPKANNFEHLAEAYPTIQAVFFNGQKAAQLFKQQVSKQQQLPRDWFFQTLPSTSPANARMNLEQKTDAWRQKLTQFL